MCYQQNFQCQNHDLRKCYSQLTYYLDTPKFQKKSIPKSKCFPQKKLKMSKNSHTASCGIHWIYVQQFSLLVALSLSYIFWQLSMKVVSYLVSLMRGALPSLKQIFSPPQEVCLKEKLSARSNPVKYGTMQNNLMEFKNHK